MRSANLLLISAGYANFYYLNLGFQQIMIFLITIATNTGKEFSRWILTAIGYQ